MTFPESTVYNRKIPKQKFYENANLPASVKNLFIKEIEEVRWVYKLSASTINISLGKVVKEIEFLQIEQKCETLSKKIIDQIAKEIPYHIVFMLVYQNIAKLCLVYKDNDGSRLFYETPAQNKDSIDLKIEGLNLDEVYRNFVRQIMQSSGSSTWSDNRSVAENISEIEKRRNIESEIAVLEKKIAKEKQFNRQMEMSDRVRELRKMME